MSILKLKAVKSAAVTGAGHTIRRLEHRKRPMTEGAPADTF